MSNHIINIQTSKKERLAPLVKLPTHKKKIALSLDIGIVIKATRDILYCQAQSNYCKIILKSGKNQLLSKTLKRVKEILNPAEFIKVHQSYPVSLDSISMLNEGLTLENDTEIPVARSKRKILQEQLGRYYQMV